jgi:hypothetical protein
MQTTPSGFLITIVSLFFSIALISTVNFTNAQTVVQVGNGTATNTSVTVTPYSCGWSDSRKQYLYLAGEILAAGGYAGEITALVFNVKSFYSSQQMNGFTLKLGHSINSVFNSTSFAASSGLMVHYSSTTNLGGTGWTNHSRPRRAFGRR